MIWAMAPTLTAVVGHCPVKSKINSQGKVRSLQSYDVEDMSGGICIKLLRRTSHYPIASSTLVARSHASIRS